MLNGELRMGLLSLSLADPFCVRSPFYCSTILSSFSKMSFA